MLSSLALSGPVLLLALLIPLYLYFLTPSPLHYSTILTSTQQTNLEEIATLLTQIYTTLAEMRYLDPASIQHGPHDLSPLLPLYKQHNLDPSLIHLYSILPYIGPPSSGVTDFFHGSDFIDFRDAEQVEESRDPYYADPDGDDFDAEHGPYMRPWVTPLSQLGNHGSVILYDARAHRIWIVDQERWDSTDPGISEEVRNAAKRGAGAVSNQNDFEYIASRPAGDVLRDINKRYRDLTELPGGGGNTGLDWSDRKLNLRELYQRSGWPDNFDGDAFEVDKARRYGSIRAKERAYEPLTDVERFHDMRASLVEQIRGFRATIANPKSLDEEWIARFELWRAEWFQKDFLVDGERTEEIAKVRCPEGVCVQEDELVLWEAEILRQDIKSNEWLIINYKKWADESRESNSERAAKFDIGVRVREKEVVVLKSAYEAALADAQKTCPGKIFESASGKDSLDPEDIPMGIRKIKEAMPRAELEIQEVEKWRTRIPEECVEAKEKVELQLHWLTAELDRQRGLLKTYGL
ncbi:hypothetical protein ASPVEDRAFT_40853 [Aspergillus versicolor CBS 583.65]|uniref:Uncharacterized protein n=1 Tax=Aspergillus versicolor CBS 583.65 TaxID=1036611 RepID=A0A1L9PIL5_ASPVE|nr:uncharacterized protein ASPVEDRAFT_40853 [Aspergillus versicolor CBS 583.65]OJJ01286.1 hypothetical protein ASPVEDRAFT_40853 [Aspergillus versicolor CBS 583.65]